MKNIIIILVLAMLAASCFSEQTDSTQATDTTEFSSVTSTTVESTTTSSSVPTSETNLPTSSPSTNAETTTGQTTSASPTSTILTSTPTSSPVPSTTPPTSSTTVAPSTTPPPTTLGHWNVTDVNGTICIKVDLKVQFTIPNGDKTETVNLSPTATTEGSTCDGFNGTQELLLSDSEYSLFLIFNKDKSDVFVQNITYTYTLPTIRGVVYNDTELFKVKADNSYRCMSSLNVKLANVTMEIYQMQIQAYLKENSGFGSAIECENDDQVNDLIPIAVGCALLALVVVVLIAYLIGRRRSRQKGYQSV